MLVMVVSMTEGGRPGCLTSDEGHWSQVEAWTDGKGFVDLYFEKL